MPVRSTTAMNRGKCNVEAQLWHLCDSGRKRNERAHDRQQACDENGDAAALLKIMRRAVEVARVQEHVFAKALDHRPSTVEADPVRDSRTDVAADRACRRDEKKIEATGRDQVARNGHGHLRLQRETCRLYRHE